MFHICVKNVWTVSFEVMWTKITQNHQESDPEAQTGPGLGSTPALMTLFGEGEPRAQGIRQDGRYSARNGRIELRQGSLYWKIWTKNQWFHRLFTWDVQVKRLGLSLVHRLGQGAEDCFSVESRGFMLWEMPNFRGLTASRIHCPIGSRQDVDLGLCLKVHGYVLPKKLGQVQELQWVTEGLAGWPLRNQ